MAFRRWGDLWIGKHIRSDRLVQGKVSLIQIKRAFGTPNSRGAPEDEHHVCCKHPSRLPRKSVSSYFAVGKGRSLLAVTFLLCALPSPPAHGMFWAGVDGLQPLRLPTAPWEKGPSHAGCGEKTPKKTHGSELTSGIELNPQAEAGTVDPDWRGSESPGLRLESGGARQGNLDFSGRLVFMQKPQPRFFFFLKQAGFARNSGVQPRDPPPPPPPLRWPCNSRRTGLKVERTSSVLDGTSSFLKRFSENS